MSRGGFRDWGTITGKPIFMLSFCGGNTDVSMEFKNSDGQSVASSSDISVSMDL